MPNAKEHKQIAQVAGLVTALIRARDQKELAILIEGVGGFFGGRLGGLIPDLIDPPINPNHRSVGHGVLPNLTVGLLAFNRLDDWQRWFRDFATEQLDLRERATDAFEQILRTVAWAVCHFIAGAIAGYLAGHTSHLILDAGTPRSLPVIG